jgi:predicted transposase YbfD/YdcC
MDTTATAGVLRAFVDIPDPRRSNRRHMLTDMLTIALFAVLSGADGWVAVSKYGVEKYDWLKTFLSLPHGIPSHDAFGRVFAMIKPEVFERYFIEWTRQLAQLSRGKLVAIDGKSLRQSYQHSWDKSGMAHMVSAFIADNHVVFAQIKTEGKGQELSAIHKLLEMLDLNGAVVTIDALGCQKEIARKILGANGQYVLQAKDNQPTLHQKMQMVFKELQLENFAGVDWDYFTQTDGDHGRIETRRVWVIRDAKQLGRLAGEWEGLKTWAVAECTREVNATKSVERHFYISSLDQRVTAKKMAGYIRGHWSVENNLHWQLDVSFNEDQRRIRIGNGAENFSRLCRMALNLLKKEKTTKVGIAIKRKQCGWSNDYLLKVVGL